MSIKKKIAIYFAVIILIASALGVFSVFNSQKIDNFLTVILPQAILQVQKTSRSAVTAQLIRYDDEVLTQSARNYALTGDKAWKDRYFIYVPKLDLRIKQAVEGVDNQDHAYIFESISDANNQLLAMEEKSIAYVDAGKLREAVAILESKEYSDQKTIYSAGLEKYIAHEGVNADSANAVSVKILEDAQTSLRDASQRQYLFTISFMALFIIVLMFLFYFMIRTFMVPLFIFKKVATNIIKGDLDSKVKIKNRDEIGDFAVDFNKMTDTLRTSLENTEKKVKERTDELEKINSFLTGRELKMIELKKKVLDLEKVK